MGGMHATNLENATHTTAEDIWNANNRLIFGRWKCLMVLQLIFSSGTLCPGAVASSAPSLFSHPPLRPVSG